MDLIKIGNTILKTPDEYDFEQIDIDSDGTKMSESGFLIRKRIRAGRIKINLSWEELTSQELKIIRDATAGESFNATYFNGESQVKTSKMYRGDVSFSKLNSDKVMWSLSFSLIEY